MLKLIEEQLRKLFHYSKLGMQNQKDRKTEKHNEIKSPIKIPQN